MKKVFNGISYYKRKNGKYYYSSYSVNGKKVHSALHRDIWEFYSGFKLKSDECIHHKDGNPENNSFENLEAVNKVAHNSEHHKELWKKLDYRTRQLENLALIRPLANQWHKTEEASKVLSDINKKYWETKETSPCVCKMCGKEFQTYFPTRTKYCSSLCWQRDPKKGYFSQFTDTRKCLLCGNDFLANKYRKTVYCSYLCSNRHRVILAKEKKI